MSRWNIVLCCLIATSACKKDEEPPPPMETATTTTPPPGNSVIAVGSPMWSVPDIALFTGPSGNGPADCLLDGPHAFDLIVWSPGDAHDPPYNTEISGKLTECGLTAKQEFAPADMEGSNSIWLGLVIVPVAGNAPGSSPDFPLGDVVYNDRYPFVIDADVRRNDLIVDSDHDFNFPEAGTWGHVVTGLSHMPMVFSTNLDRMPAGATSPGDYHWQVRIRDATSIVAESGYDLIIPYTVTAPE